MIKLEKSVWIYLIALIVFSYLWQLFVIFKGGEEYPLFSVWVGVMMFFPAIGAFIVLLKNKQGLRYIIWGIGKPLYSVLGLVLPTVITFLGVLLIEYLGWGLNRFFAFQNGEVKVLNDIALLETGTFGYLPFFSRFLLSGIILSLVVSVIAIGEEIGWRGYLQKKLLEKNGTFRSLVFLGLVWGAWHGPLILSGFNFPEFPILGALIFFPLTTLSISLLFGWLTINAGSFWPAVFAHAGINSIMAVMHSMNFAENGLQANIFMVAFWATIGGISYFLIKKRLPVSLE